MSKKQREKVEDEVRYHRAAQQRAQQVEIPDTTISSYNEGHQTPSSTDHHIFPNTTGYPYSSSVEGGVYSGSTYYHQQIQDPYISTDPYTVDSTTCYDLPRPSLTDNIHTVDTTNIISNTITTGHAPLRKHLMKVCLSQSSECRLCGEEEESAEHIWLDCRDSEKIPGSISPQPQGH
ncbi:hypothetical protein J6590_028615 [Homalodisca vitripennis]|nr:hypothetical protein J6590_028615 [Homalodisca vitripennis]